MNIPFDIGSGNGPVIFDPIRTMEQARRGARRGGGLGPVGPAACRCVWGRVERVGGAVGRGVRQRPSSRLPSLPNPTLNPTPPEPWPPTTQVNKVTKLNAGESCGFVGESLKQLRAAVGNQAAVMGFVGAPFTLATYIVEGTRRWAGWVAGGGWGWVAGGACARAHTLV